MLTHNVLSEHPLPQYSNAQIAHTQEWQRALAGLVWQAGEDQVYWQPCEKRLADAWQMTAFVAGMRFSVVLSPELASALVAPSGLRLEEVSADARALWCATVASGYFAPWQIEDLQPVNDVAVQMQAFEFLSAEGLPWYLGLPADLPASKLLADLGNYLSPSRLPDNGHWPICLPMVCMTMAFDAQTLVDLSVGDVLLLEHA